MLRSKGTTVTTILVVDDHAVSREFLTTLFGYRGYRVLEAADGKEALEKVRHAHPDLVVADVLMPTMDGFEFVKRVRAEPDIEQTRVIFYTASYHEHEAKNLASSCGVSDVLTKPSDPEIVLDTVERVLKEVTVLSPMPEREQLDQRHLQLLTNKLKYLADDLGSTNERYATLIEINLQLASERDPKALMDSLCKISRKLIGAKYAVLAVKEKRDHSLLYTSFSGFTEEVSATMQVNDLWQGGIASQIKKKKNVRMENINRQKRNPGLPSGHPDVNSVLAVPIMSLSRIYGWICLSDRLGADKFNEEDERLLTILAAQAGRIYENGSLYASLLEQEERFRQIAENIHDVFWLVSVETGEDIYISPAFEDVWGRPSEPGGKRFDNWLDAVHPEDRELIPTELNEETEYDLEYRIIRPDGSIRWIHDRGFPVHNAQGQVYRVAGIAKDITKRKTDEQKIARLTRIYSVLSQINSAIVRIHEREALFEEVCHIVVEHGKLAMAWLGRLDQDTGNIIQVAHQGGDSQRSSLTDRIDGLNLNNAGAGIVGQALSGAEPVYCNDISAAKSVGSFRNEAVKQGYFSVASLPIQAEDRVVGILVLFATERGFFDATEMKLLNELANDISFALDYIKKAEQANYLAYYDALTGLSNRTLFHERLSQLIHISQHESERLALVIIDLDRFKTINDTFGRQAGDNLIRQLTQRLREHVKDSAHLARVGADQFALLLPDLKHADDVARTLDYLIKACVDEPFKLNGDDLRVSAKGGIALFPEDGNNAESLFLNAELAVKGAKNKGAQFVFFDRQMSEKVTKSLEMENMLRQALDNQQFILFYQPKVDLKTGRISGLEALIRWNSPTLGLVSPVHFIPLLEQTGLILDVGNWVMEQAVRDIINWQQQGVRVPRVAVNVSAFQLKQSDFVARTRRVVRALGSEMLLDLELTESMLLGDVEDSLSKLSAIRASGLEVAIDDFGTGYSSLSYIARLPIDSLKIDRSFIVKMSQHDYDMIIVSTIITMAHNMGLKVVAEGVDDMKQVNILKKMGCDQVQGYLFSHPISSEALQDLLLQDNSFGLS
jgi:diguanylate cyclase